MDKTKQDEDPKAVLNAVRDAIHNYRKDHYNCHDLGDIGVFVSERDYDRLHDFREFEANPRGSFEPDDVVADGTTIWKEHLPPETTLYHDPQMPDGHPRVLPESIEDFDPNDRLQDILTTHHARQLVTNGYRVEVEQEPGEPSDMDRLTLKANVAFEVLCDSRTLDHDRIERENLGHCGSEWFTDYTGDDSFPTRDVPMNVRYHGPTYGSYGGVDRSIKSSLLERLMSDIQAAVGSVYSWPVTGEKEVYIEPDRQPVRAEPDLAPDSVASLDYETERRSMACGERRIWLGRIWIPDPYERPVATFDGGANQERHIQQEENDG